MSALALLADPAAWAALATLVVMEIVLGIDNLIFIAVLSNKLPENTRQRARRTGIGLALAMRLLLLTAIAWIIGLQATVIDLGITGPAGAHGEPSFETALSWKDIILIAGGLFLMYKATREIHHSVDAPAVETDSVAGGVRKAAELTFTAAILQIIALDIVFSIDSILTAVGMTEHVAIMYVAVVIAVGVMLVAADPLANFIGKNPSVVMLALGFLLMVGMVLVAEGFGAHVPKGYIYTAMGFSGAIEGLNIWQRRAKARKVARGSH
ncbi:TerC family protein [Sphingomonas sp. GC_Shp_3]|uniref:TerC family protein n=1 Tax=Sphingomonas sp. GC_Shp_3 TaxID=2937383 RepID=UPI00226A4652|nr:TerC family protein [Sphingomonas sp. GC_Shp_3]